MYARAEHGVMSPPDLNLLVALEVLLEEVSVARAARRLRLSPSAMSRTLARLRAATGDPLLVRAGRKLVATPRASELRDQVGAIVRGAEAALRPSSEIDPAALERTFTLRTSEGFVETFGPALLSRVAREAPNVRLFFVPKADKDSGPLREGSVDLETGVVDSATGPELRTQALFSDRLIAVVRDGHPLQRGRVTLARYLAASHIEVRRSTVMESLLAPHARRIATLVAGFATAVALARATDLVATVPERHTEALRFGMHAFKLPFEVPPFTVSMLWHPRLDADPAHRWLRACVRAECAEQRPRRTRPAKAAAPRSA